MPLPRASFVQQFKEEEFELIHCVGVVRISCQDKSLQILHEQNLEKRNNFSYKVLCLVQQRYLFECPKKWYIVHGARLHNPGPDILVS